MAEKIAVLPGEIWKKVKVNSDFVNPTRLEISNLGRLRSVGPKGDERLLKFSLISGYGSLKRRYYHPRDPKLQVKFDNMKQQIFKQQRAIKKRILEKAKKTEIKEMQVRLATMKSNLSVAMHKDMDERTEYVHWLAHRLVAEYFLPKPKKNQTVVSHLDFNKLNNRADNLQWMTAEENYDHQSKSPFVIEEKKRRTEDKAYVRRFAKLTIPKVAMIKKMLQKGKSFQQLAEKFNVSHTQIKRIARNENWQDVEPAQ